jgi:hypothetical protein
MEHLYSSGFWLIAAILKGGVIVAGIIASAGISIGMIRKAHYFARDFSAQVRDRVSKV